MVSTHSRPKAAVRPTSFLAGRRSVSTHSRPKAAAEICYAEADIAKFQHTAARRRLRKSRAAVRVMNPFQHTAARRRLLRLLPSAFCRGCFNTQPPEGGWSIRRGCCVISRFQHTAARRRLIWYKEIRHWNYWFQHTAARRRLRRRQKESQALNGFQHTAARRRLPLPLWVFPNFSSFNTQPPEGG